MDVPEFRRLAAFRRSELVLAVATTAGVLGFDILYGVLVAVGLSLIDLQNGQEINLASNLGEPVPMPPDVAFSASSTIKIPIMISVFRRLGENIDEETRQNLNDMIAKSINPASDWLMEKVIDPVKGPLMVTEDAVALGLENTFLAGYFFPGAPLLQRFLTPAAPGRDWRTRSLQPEHSF